MASLVSEILSSAGHLDKENLNQEIHKLSRKIEVIKVQVQDSLDSCYSCLSPIYVDAEQLNQQLNTAAIETKSISDKIEKELKPNLQDAVSKSDSVVQEIERTSLLIKIVSWLLDIHNCLENCETAKEASDYKQAALQLDEIGKLLKEIPYESTKDLSIYQTLKTEQRIRRETLVYELGEMWKQKVGWKFPSADKTTCELTINSQDKQIYVILGAFSILKHLNRTVEVFGQSLMTSFVEPIVTATVQFDVGVDDTTTFKLNRLSNDKPEAQQVCQHLKLLFSTLDRVFPSSHGNGDNGGDGDSNGNHDSRLITVLGQFYSERFCNQLIKKCLEPAVPSQSQQLEAYSATVATVVQLDEYLQEIGFLQGGQSGVINYAKNHDSFFANKICQDILSKARDKMKSDLFITKEIKPPAGKTSPTELEMTIEEAFTFPACKISKFTEEVLDIVQQTLTEACNSSSVSATRLYFTARHVVEMYCDVVPVFHANSIAMFPQQTAIHHNNCMYLAHRLLTVANSYKFKLRLTTEKLGNFPTVSFVDIASKLRTVGTEAFLEQMRSQRQHLLDFLQGSGVFQDMSNENDFLMKGDKAVRQCLLHLSSLKNVWVGVLPAQVYLKAMGTLCNSCLEEIIASVIRQEDITERATNALDMLFGNIIRDMPLLFKVDNERDISELVVCQKQVRKWSKFQELKSVLVSNLREIVDRWASGKGPLALEFNANEVKQLIRALFQNTERRAKALTSFK